MELSNTKFLDFLVEQELLEEKEATKYLNEAEEKDADLYDYIYENQIIDLGELGKALADKYGVGYIDLTEETIRSEVIQNMPEVVAQKNDAIVFSETDEVVKVAMFDPENDQFIENVKNKIKERSKKERKIIQKANEEDIAQATQMSKDELINYANTEYNLLLEGENKQEILNEFEKEIERLSQKEASSGDKNVEIYFAHKEGIKKEINENYESSNDDFARMIQDIIDEGGEDANPEDVPIIKIVDELLNYAYENGTSDIHIEPYEDKTLIRFRIDGILHDIISIPKSLHELVVTRIKILSRMRTDEHRAAQDGKLKFEHSGDQIDVRVSIVPIVYGEKVVMRLLAENAGQFTIESLGFRDEDMKNIKENIDKPWGMILATGPTGSGKTTTLYSTIKRLNTREVNISTIEDPVEYGIESINQIQVNEEADLTFSNGLRAIVRQDPDIIMVGEIRDQETAQIAVNAAMTGHLVLSTLHTNDSATTLPRLLDMGVQPFLVSSTINIAIAQRLVRKICEDCKKSKKIDAETEDLVHKELSDELINEYDLDNQSTEFYYGEGCSTCQDTGYDGRVGIYEVLDMTGEIKEMVMEQENADAIKQRAIENGMLPLIESGIEKVLEGETTIEELLRVIQE